MVLRIVYGSALLLVPRRSLAGLSGRRVDSRATAFARLLGARHLLEATLLARRRGPRWTLVGAAIDGAHSVTMLWLSATRAGQRRLAATNAAAAALAAAARVVEASHQAAGARGA